MSAMLGSPDGAQRSLIERLAPDLRLAEPLRRHTSFRVGGPADLFLPAAYNR